METRILICRKFEHAFLERWKLERLYKMQLEDFTDTNNQDTFCYWVERASIRLGSIKGHPSIKFGIYKRSNSEERPGNYDGDDFYSWAPGLKADNSREAFRKVKQMVIDTATAAWEHRFEDIDAIHLNHLFKWKIAALYAREHLVPIFKKTALMDIARSRGIAVMRRPVFSSIYAQLMAQKPADKNVYEFAMALLKGYHHTDEKGYYVLGSKYGGTQDMLPEMIDREVVATGFGDSTDFSFLRGLSEKDMEHELKNINIDGGGKLTRPAVEALKHFLRLQPGDIIAVKASGNPKGGNASLTIVTYAMVVERDGKTYFPDDHLGQCIHVEFLQTHISRVLPIGGLAHTMHRITDEETIDRIFGAWVNEGKAINQTRSKRRRRKAGGTRNTTNQQRKGSKPYVAHMKHNEIQNAFIASLQERYGVHNVFPEEDFVDVKLVHRGVTTLFEIKPYALAEDCIRTGLGQLLSYAHFDTGGSPPKVRIVGPYPANKAEKRFISYLKERLDLDFDYQAFPMP